MARGVHTSGVLASESGTLNYLLKHVAPAFEASRLVLPWLRDAQLAEGPAPEPERRGSGEAAAAVHMLEGLFSASPDSGDPDGAVEGAGK